MCSLDIHLSKMDINFHNPIIHEIKVIKDVVSDELKIYFGSNKETHIDGKNEDEHV